MTDRETIAVYEAEVDRYRSIPMEDLHRTALQSFADAVRPGGDILDLGCGPGSQSEYLAARGFQMDAIDATPAFVAAALARGIPARLASFEELPGQYRYDGIWASFSLLHAQRATVAPHVRRLGAALRPGGVFFLGMKLGSGEARDTLGRFYSYFTVEELQAMLTQAGLTLASTTTASGKGLSGSVDPYVLLQATRNA